MNLPHVHFRALQSLWEYAILKLDIVTRMRSRLFLLVILLFVTMAKAQTNEAQDKVNSSIDFAGQSNLSISVDASKSENGTRSNHSIDIGMGHNPVDIYIPVSYSSVTPMPLVILLHGYTGNGSSLVNYWGFEELAEEFGFFLLAPTGRVATTSGLTFWSATSACCNFYGDADNDVDYLIELVDYMKTNYNIDSRRVYIGGHSNGGFMSHRIACEHPETFAAIVSLAGSMFEDPANCENTEPIHILQIHGTADGTIEYYEPAFTYDAPGGYFPGAVRTVEQWAALNGCEITADTTAPNIDLDSGLTGNESTVTKYKTACDPGGSTELWTINGGAHSPTVSSTFGRQIIEWLYAHPKRPTEAWIDFSWTGIKNGLQDFPFSSLNETLPIMAESSSIKVKGDTNDSDSSESLIIDQIVAIEALNGSIRIGVSENPDPAKEKQRNSGFVTRVVHPEN